MLVVLTGVLVFVGSRGSSLPSTVGIDSVPSSYRVVYEVATAGGPDQPDTVTTEVLQVERPWRSLSVTRSGDRLVNGRVSDLNRLLVFNDGTWQELQVPPAMAASDLRLDGDVLSSLDRVDEVRRIAGRPCQVFLAGGPIAAGEVAPVDGGSDGESAELCIDEAGLVLFEEWTGADGDVLRRREAVDVDVDPDFDDDTFTVTDAEVLSATDGGGSATRVEDDFAFGDRTWTLPSVPSGFSLEGRWTIVRPRLSTEVDPLADPTAGRVAGIATVWVDGIDALVVEQGGTNDGSRVFLPHPDGEEVDLGDALDLGEVITDARGTEVRVAYTDGSFVRVWSTLPRDEVLELARSLEPR